MKIIIRLLLLAIVSVLLGVGSIYALYLHVRPELPDVATLKDVKLQTPMLIYSEDGKLIAQFGEKRRIPVKFSDIPQQLINALIATEDSRFYDHYGLDPIGIARAIYIAATSGNATQGASTITQQLARNFFLNNERKLMRKVKEAFIAIHIEQQLSKQEILELYVNKIFLGYRAYGFGAAARVYFDKSLDQLTLSDVAMLAGMPKAPSTMNPLHSLSRATARRNVVLQRMLEEGYIDSAQFASAKNEPIVASYHSAEIELNAPYVAEMARSWAVEQFGEDVYESGYRIYTTINSKTQINAENAALDNLFAYDERHGYRGATARLWQAGAPAWSAGQITKHLAEQPVYGRLLPAVVLNVGEKRAKVQTIEGNRDIAWDDMLWARPFKSDNLQGNPPQKPSDVLASGQQIWVRRVGDRWRLSQVPDANTAFVVTSPDTGAIKALVGGFSFAHSKFNRVTQSVRQVGSSIKPFIYSAGLEHGITLATLINDAPINHWDAGSGVAWRPKNSPAVYDGPLTARQGLARSKNVMAIRLLRQIGLDNTIDFLTRFGFKASELPRAEPLALGAGNLTPLQMAQGFGVFANGGYYVQSYWIKRVETAIGERIYTALSPQECAGGKCEATVSTERVISDKNAFLVREMLEANIWGGGSWKDKSAWMGTGWRAMKVLNRRDIGGKTGTTNDSKDAWYVGFAPKLVVSTWIGFDNHSRNLGYTSRYESLNDPIFGAEAGGKSAQPAWNNFMKRELASVPEQTKVVPSGIVQVRIDRRTGLLTRKEGEGTMMEYFVAGTEPTRYGASTIRPSGVASATDELF